MVGVITISGISADVHGPVCRSVSAAIVREKVAVD